MQVFLQLGFRVFEAGRGLWQGAEVVFEERECDVFAGGVVAVQGYRGDERVDGVRQDGGAPRAAAFQFAAAQMQVLAEVEAAGDGGEVFAADDGGAQAGEVAFGYVAAVLVDPDAADGFEEGGVGVWRCGCGGSARGWGGRCR